MDDPKWLRLITVGLMLSVVVVIYLLFTGTFIGEKNKKVSIQTGQVNGVKATPTPVPVTAYNKIAERTQASVETLPNTGFPI